MPARPRLPGTALVSFRQLSAALSVGKTATGRGCQHSHVADRVIAAAVAARAMAAPVVDARVGPGLWQAPQAGLVEDLLPQVTLRTPRVRSRRPALRLGT